MPDADVSRFVEPQRADFHRALDEIEAGRKRSHWIWYVFPQIVGLGSSPMAVRYGITSPAEARAFLDDPELGDELETARDLVRRRLVAARPRLSDPVERDRQTRRALGMLARKGYGGALAARAVREVMREVAGPGSDLDPANDHDIS